MTCGMSRRTLNRKSPIWHAAQRSEPLFLFLRLPGPELSCVPSAHVAKQRADFLPDLVILSLSDTYRTENPRLVSPVMHRVECLAHAFH